MFAMRSDPKGFSEVSASKAKTTEFTENVHCSEVFARCVCEQPFRVVEG